MSTTNYGFEVPTGDALVNPLTIDAPNWEKLDDVLKGVQDDSIQEATELVSDKVHAITCFESGARFMHFTATGDYRTGDTFTFNGAPIAAYLPDGSGLSDYAYRVNSEVLISIVGNRLTIYSYAGSTTAENALNLGGQPPEYYGKATETVATYTHSYVGGVHNFVGNGANGKVKFVANVQAGDKVQVNGLDVTAYANTDDFVSNLTGANLIGKSAYLLYDSSSQTVTFAVIKEKAEPVQKIWGSATVDLSAYNSERNTFITPSEGVVVADSALNAWCYIRCTNLPSGSNSNYLASGKGDGNSGGFASAYVPKGASIYISGTFNRANFHPVI